MVDQHFDNNVATPKTCHKKVTHECSSADNNSIVDHTVCSLVNNNNNNNNNTIERDMYTIDNNSSLYSEYNKYNIKKLQVSTQENHVHTANALSHKEDSYESDNEQPNNKNHIHTHTQDNNIPLTKRYIRDLENSNSKLPRNNNNNVTSSAHHTNYSFQFFKPGISFRGFQFSRLKSHKVEIKINHINFNNNNNKNNTIISQFEPNVIGILSIHNLTKNNPLINTFFEGYIIDQRNFTLESSLWPRLTATNSHTDVFNPFLTRDSIDILHWNQFNLNIPNSNINLFKNGIYRDRYILMKWKEKCLINNNNNNNNASLCGASYEGFYYIVLDLMFGTIEGYYYHERTTKFQELFLRPIVNNNNLTTNCSYNFV